MEWKMRRWTVVNPGTTAKQKIDALRTDIDSKR